MNYHYQITCTQKKEVDISFDYVKKSENAADKIPPESYCKAEPKIIIIEPKILPTEVNSNVTTAVVENYNCHISFPILLNLSRKYIFFCIYINLKRLLKLVNNIKAARNDLYSP